MCSAKWSKLSGSHSVQSHNAMAILPNKTMKTLKRKIIICCLKIWHFDNWNRIIYYKSGSPGSPDSADNFEFSAEGLSENAKTISLSPWKLTILQCVTNKGQEVLKSLAEKHKISDLHVLGFRSFAFKWSMFETFYWFTHFCRKILMSRFTHFFRKVFMTEKWNPQTFSLLECMPWCLTRSCVVVSKL